MTARTASSATPRVSVLMAVYNAAPYVRASLESILTQSLGELEVVVVDDGSTDGSGAVVERMAAQDARVRVLRQENRGLPAALNAGLALARAPLVARMDADDLALPLRLERQAAYLDAHPEVAVLGGFVRTFGQARGNVWRYPVGPAAVAAAMPFVNPIAHPAVMFRRAVVEAQGGYDEANAYGEDYALWAALSARHALDNLPEVVLRYRVHGGQMGAVRADDVRRQWYMRTQAAVLGRLGLHPEGEALALHHRISTAHWATAEVPAGSGFRDAAEAWLLGLAAADAATGVFEARAFARRLGWHWRMVCRAQAGEGLAVWRQYRRSALAREAARAEGTPDALGGTGADDLALLAACALHFGQQRRRALYGALRRALRWRQALSRGGK